MIKLDKLIFKKILLFLEPKDLQNTLDANSSYQSIIEDSNFWEKYLKMRNRNLPKRLSTVSQYYLDYYSNKQEAQRWIKYMKYNHNNLHDPIYSFDDELIMHLDSNLFIKFDQFYKYLIDIKGIAQQCNQDWGQIKVRLAIFLEKGHFKCYFLAEKVQMVEVLFEKEIIYSQEEMTEIISILLSNNFYFRDYDGTPFRLPW